MSHSQTTPASSKPEPDLSGHQLGDYQLLRRLGRGGMADVYLAEQLSLHRQVAFKVLKSSLAGDANYVRRFHNEARAAASLVHANIVQIHEVGCLDGHHFIAQEYVPGQNLKQLLTRRGPLEVPLAVNIMRQVAAALHRAGEQKIIHRDIKPENILLAPTGELKVADFGLARISVGGNVDLTQVGITMGTPLYMSPEQVEGGQLDPRSDLYSFGVMAYQMLAGRTPFEGETALSVAVQHLKKEPERLERLRPDVPAGLCRIIHKLLAKEPAARYQRAAELLRDLRGLKLEGSDGWPDELDDWSTSELLALADSRNQATQQLATVMLSESSHAQRRGYARAILGLVALAVAAGGVAAWWTRPQPLLQVSAAELQKVEKKDSAEAQYWHAFQVGTEQAWKSVWEGFPQDDPRNERYSRLAKRRLAEYYRDREQYDLALALYEQLTSLDDPQLEAIGWAGQANIHALRGSLDEAKQKLIPILQLLDELDPQVRSTLDEQLEPALQPEFVRLVREKRLADGDT